MMAWRSARRVGSSFRGPTRTGRSLLEYVECYVTSYAGQTAPAYINVRKHIDMVGAMIAVWVKASSPNVLRMLMLEVGSCVVGVETFRFSIINLGIRD